MERSENKGPPRKRVKREVLDGLPIWLVLIHSSMAEPVSNHLGQPVGFPLRDWEPPPKPPREPMSGRFCRVEPLDPARHGQELHAANSLDRDGAMWTYLAYGPFPAFQSYQQWLWESSQSQDPVFYTIVDLASERAAGVAGYLRIDPAGGSIEVGHIAYSPPLQRTPAATEAMFLMLQRVFQLGYRRCEWKCDALHARSRAAAERLGFSFEGVFRQATVYKGRNRDTAWFSVIDGEWPGLERAFSQWLDPSNFDRQGRQRMRLASFRRSGR
jgi:RimJ/RimL family protein N-acetyltransferase